MDGATILITGLGLAIAAGLNAYIPLMVEGLLVRFNLVSFADPYDSSGARPALIVIGVLLAVEIFADKIPALDSVNDAVQTFIRPASGAVLFAAAAAGAEWQWAQALAVVVGLLTALGVHSTKAAARPVINVSTAGVGGPVASVVEDGVSLGLALAALLAPLIALGLLVGLAWFAFSATRRIRRRRSGSSATAT